MNNLTLSPDEICEITGFSQPCKQLEALRSMGFTRARRKSDGKIILERAHYIAVCNGQFKSGTANESTGPAVNLSWMRKNAA